MLHRLQIKIKEETASAVKRDFPTYKPIQKEYKRLGLGAKGSHVKLKKKLVGKMSKDK